MAGCQSQNFEKKKRPPIKHNYEIRNESTMMMLKFMTMMMSYGLMISFLALCHEGLPECSDHMSILSLGQSSIVTQTAQG